MAELSQVTLPSYLKMNLISTSLVRASLGTNEPTSVRIALVDVSWELYCLSALL